MYGRRQTKRSEFLLQKEVITEEKSCHPCLIKIIFFLRTNSYLVRGHSSEQTFVTQLGDYLGGLDVVFLPKPNLLTQVRAKQIL